MDDEFSQRRTETDVSPAQIASRTQPCSLWHAVNSSDRLHFLEKQITLPGEEAGERGPAVTFHLGTLQMFLH